MSPTRVEIVDKNGIHISVTDLNQGDTLCYPLIPRKPGTQELVVVFPNASYNHCLRRKIGPFTGPWEGTYHTVMPNKSPDFPVEPGHRLIIKNIK